LRSIYFCIQHYPNWRTGGHKFHSILYEYAISKGYDAYVFGNTKIEDKYYKNKFIRIFYGLWNTFKIPSGALILMTNASFLDYILPIILNKIFKRHKYFFIVHHLVQDEKPSSIFRKLLETQFVKLADGFIAVSETTKKRLQVLNLVEREIPVVSPGVDKNNFCQGSKVFPNKHKLLYVGTIERRKGLIDLIDALKFIEKFDYELNIIGELIEDDYYKDILNKIKAYKLDSNVNFLGRVSRDILSEYYLNSTVLVFPSHWEGYGMVVAEALSFGLPVLVTKIPVFEELIENGKHGLLFEVADSKGIANLLRRVFDNSKELTIMSINALNKVNELYSWDETSEKVMKILENFMNENQEKGE